jgi:hypothetical protein
MPLLFFCSFNSHVWTWRHAIRLTKIWFSFHSCMETLDWRQANRDDRWIDSDLCTLSNVLRHIHVGLLCVQQKPEDEPNMSSTVQMLNSESSLPKPRQSGFFSNSLEVDPSSRVGNSGRRVGFVSTRLTRKHNRVWHEPDPIINRVRKLNTNTARYWTGLHDTNPQTRWASLSHWVTALLTGTASLHRPPPRPSQRVGSKPTWSTSH